MEQSLTPSYIVVKQPLPSDQSTNIFSKKILIAEDQTINMEVMKQQMEQLGLNEMTEFCANGRDALDFAIE
jgi:hypothetical protein